ncbi:hypothetical protein AHFPHNDE_03210 [Pseudomonas sp. MM227]|uniref:Uncharacterized protein n=2 Tax=Pseudomonas TaxID=286 RepID=A0A7X1G7W6_9PSED|nr:hypothetical protein [Pseudomonas baltica]MBD8605107.1 hypothetical protein [Pseudomonas sp. CFBP 8771]MBD8623865.1 hypothetical protein [Pseudomonas sp. CFBP 13727]MBD8731216.1 hypothetical protein [Pseudomonas sp. CFBP 13710]MBD8826117.1 hypothetical protein [Pseudomonas sp. CFBP 13602]CAI3789507.1 hypothetical protein AHFPHNDE_03210 [Pseudomonas sp. MM227]
MQSSLQDTPTRASSGTLTGLLMLSLAITLTVISGKLLAIDALWPSYGDMMANLHHPAAWWRWVVGDISEVAFYKHEFASIGLLAGAGLGWWANHTGKRWQGFAICYGTGLWPWVVTSSLLGLGLGNLLWGWTLSADTWQPTFVAFVSMPAATVLLFGRGWRVALTGAVMGAVLITPACLLIVKYVCTPLALPVVIGNVTGMAVGSVIGFLLCKRFPVLVRPDAAPAQAPPVVASPANYGLRWTLRRILADFSEAPFFGNEWASLGLVLGALLALMLNPASPFYGSGWLLQLLAAQTLASALGVLIWRRQWIARGWYPTYIPVVSVAPAAILVHGGSLPVIILSAALGALLAPPLAVAISQRLPSYMHGYIGNVLSMAISTVLILPLIGLIIGSPNL